MLSKELTNTLRKMKANKWYKAAYKMRYMLLAVLIYVVGLTFIMLYIYLPMELRDAKRNRQINNRQSWNTL